MRSIIEYIWIGGEMELRSKARVLVIDHTLTKEQLLKKIPDWNYDGSSTKQAKGNDSEIIIKPRKIVNCPFRKNNNYLVLCDTYKPDGTPVFNNNRVNAYKIFRQNLSEEPWFGIEQEFFIMNSLTNQPLGFNNETYEKITSQGQNYCSVGSLNSFGRKIMDRVLDNLLYAELDVSGINAEVAPGQWEYQIGPVVGIDAGDQLWMSRYILERTCEGFNTHINYDPKPLEGDWNGSGLHTNYSTKSMREGTAYQTGLQIIDSAITKLSLKHDQHMLVYGKDNDKRMTGEYETAQWDKFTVGRANRGASIRIGNETIVNKRGYFEDRRPASNADPYQVTSIIFETTNV
jgi:glutamine synthetase